MTLNEAALKAEIILIDGDRGAGKNTLAIHFLSLFGQEDQSAAIVTIPKEIYQKTRNM
jgi:tRNA A37 threonylcarbamoyladenosine biosynthesis protein TsaE